MAYTLWVMKLVYAVGLMGILSAPAWAVEPVRLSYDAEGAPVTFERDKAGTYRVEGLPYPGEVIYRQSNGAIYYRHPDIPEWLVVPVGAAELASATMVKGAAWEKWQDQATFSYDVKAGNDTCAPVYVSQGVGVQAGLTVSDVMRILGTVAWLNAGKAAPSCDRLAVEARLGEVAGLPVHFTGPNGDWQLQTFSKAEVAKISLPAHPQPVDEATRLDLLMRQFGPGERKGFITSYGNLPVGQQIHLVEEALSGMGQP